MAGMKGFQKIASAICFAYLSLMMLSEVYSAAATALDKSPDYPTWEPTLGRWLYVLPCLSATGMFFLFLGRRTTLAFWLITSSFALYFGFLLLESFIYQGEASIAKFNSADAAWGAALLIAVGAAYWFKRLTIVRMGE